MIGIHTYARKLLEDIHMPKYASQSKINTILQLQELRDLLPNTTEGMMYREAIDIQVLKFNPPIQFQPKVKDEI